jgi:hypothetical protein
VAAETGALEGLTEIGRASVARLQLNNPLQIKARLRWPAFSLRLMNVPN